MKKATEKIENQIKKADKMENVIYTAELLEKAVTLSKKETTKKALEKSIKLDKESLITQYLDGAYKYANTQKLTKDGKPYSYNSLLSEYKANLYATILKEEGAEIKSDIYNLLNIVLKKIIPSALVKFRLMNLITLTKFSKLTNSYIKNIDYSKSLNDIVEDINIQYSSLLSNNKDEELKNKVKKSGYKLVKVD